MASIPVVLDDATIAHAAERYLALRERLPRIAVAEVDEVLATLPGTSRSSQIPRSPLAGAGSTN